jgi:hypothetical protein
MCNSVLSVPYSLSVPVRGSNIKVKCGMMVWMDEQLTTCRRLRHEILRC